MPRTVILGPTGRGIRTVNIVTSGSDELLETCAQAATGPTGLFETVQPSSSPDRQFQTLIIPGYTGGGGGGYVAKAVHFDGATYLRSTGEIFSGSSSRGLLSAWRYSTLDDLTNPPMLLALQDYSVELDFGFFNEPEPLLQDFSLYIFNNDFSSLFNIKPVHSIATTGWTNLLFAWDTNFAAGQKVFHLCVNGVTTTAELSITDANDAFQTEYTGKTLTLFANAETVAGSKILGDFSDFYFAPNQFLDLTDSANVSKFIAAGKPVDLGADGSLPTGVSPAVFLSGDAAGYAVNRGSAGDVFTVNGALTNATTSPSD